MNELVGLDEVVIKKEGCLYTTGILLCTVVVLINKEQAGMLHLSEDKNGRYDINKLKELVDSFHNDYDAYIFPGKVAKEENINLILDNVIGSLYKPYETNYISAGINKCTIGYDISKKSFFGVDDDENFVQYEIEHLNLTNN